MTVAAFDPVKHGPAVWKLQGLKWTDRELGMARIFAGNDAAKLAQKLKIESRLAEIEAILSPAEVAPEAPETPEVPAVPELPEVAPTPSTIIEKVTTFLDSLKPAVIVPDLGSIHHPRRYCHLYSLTGGGWTFEGKDWDGVGIEPIGQDNEGTVLSVHGEGADAFALVLIRHDPTADYAGAKLARVALPAFGRLFKPQPIL